jgi:hypothetical protein
MPDDRHERHQAGRHLSDDELDDILVRSAAISVVKTATPLAGLEELKQRLGPPQTLCWHCGKRHFVGAWMVGPRPEENLLCLCLPCADELLPRGRRRP